MCRRGGEEREKKITYIFLKQVNTFSLFLNNIIIYSCPSLSTPKAEEVIAKLRRGLSSEKPFALGLLPAEDRMGRLHIHNSGCMPSTIERPKRRKGRLQSPQKQAVHRISIPVSRKVSPRDNLREHTSQRKQSSQRPKGSPSSAPMLLFTLHSVHIPGGDDGGTMLAGGGTLEGREAVGARGLLIIRFAIFSVRKMRNQFFFDALS